MRQSHKVVIMPRTALEQTFDTARTIDISNRQHAKHTQKKSLNRNEKSVPFPNIQKERHRRDENASAFPETRGSALVQYMRQANSNM